MPPPYPDGWYCVAFSWEVARGSVVSVQALGRELAVWRADNGDVAVCGAYCVRVSFDAV